MAAIQTALPIAFAGLIAGLVGFALTASGGALLERITHSFAGAFGTMSCVLIVALCWDLARRRTLPIAAMLAIGVGAFVWSLPSGPPASFEALMRSIGSGGIFLAIIIALASAATLRAAIRRFGVVLGSIVAGIAVIGVAGALAAGGVSLSGALAALLAPLGSLGDSLPALLLIALANTLLWSVGIHGPAMLSAVVLPVYLSLQAQNTAAVAGGAPLPHIVTVSIFLFVFPGGVGSTLPLVILLLRSRHRRIRSVAYASLVPAIFNANEPLMFGLPLVLNASLALPFIFTPLVLALTSYGAIAAGWVARPAFYIPSSIPQPIGVFLATKDWRAVALIAVNIAIAMAMYAPFVAAYDRAEAKRAA